MVNESGSCLILGCGMLVQIISVRARLGIVPVWPAALGLRAICRTTEYFLIKFRARLGSVDINIASDQI